MKEPRLRNPDFAITMSEGFYAAGQGLALKSSSDDKTGYIWISPAVVNFSFATELILKGLLMIDGNVSTRGHKLFDLYKNIRPTTRQRVETLYQERTKNSKSDLPAYKFVVTRGDEDRKPSRKSSSTTIEDLLRIHNESFENWRYLYEFGQEGYEYEFDFKAMDNFYAALRDTLKELIKNRAPKFGMKRAGT